MNNIENILGQKVNEIEQLLNSPIEMTEEELSSNIQLLLHNNGMLANAIAGVQADLESGFDNIDPINDEILSESNLTLYSPTIDCNVETYGSLVKVSGDETVDQAKEAFRQDLVDQTIIEQNPIYDYKLFSNQIQTRMVSMGTFVVNDYETVEVETEDGVNEVTYYQVKILADVPSTDNSTIGDNIGSSIWGDANKPPRLRDRINDAGDDTMVNRKYYVDGTSFESLQDGAVLELLNKQGDNFVSAGLYAEVYLNTIFTKRAGSNGMSVKKQHKPTHAVAYRAIRLTVDEKAAWQQAFGTSWYPCGARAICAPCGEFMQGYCVKVYLIMCDGHGRQHPVLQSSDCYDCVYG